MRELLYISTRKLDAFIDDRRFCMPSVGGEAEISLLESVKLKLSARHAEADTRAAELRRRAQAGG
jgi:hypothetical protein